MHLEYASRRCRPVFGKEMKATGKVRKFLAKGRATRKRRALRGSCCGAAVFGRAWSLDRIAGQLRDCSGNSTGIKRILKTQDHLDNALIPNRRVQQRVKNRVFGPFHVK